MSWLQKLSSLPGLSDKIGGALLDLAYSKGTRLWNVEDEAEKLGRTEKRIRALLKDAEERRYIDDESVKFWLRELKAVAFDAESLLDRLTTMTAVAKLDSAEPSRKRKRSWLTVQLGPRQRWRLDAKISEINERLDEIAKSRKRYRFQSGDATRRAQPGQRPRFSEATSCHADRSQVFGRAKEKKEIVQELLSDHAIPLPVISIYGVPGIGKTTLARIVYNDAEVKSFFATKIWVCLSVKCDERRTTEMILEDVTGVKCDALSLDILQQRLREHLSTKKFLLVIDNLWSEDYNFWESLRCPLLAGEKGSKVLITTRNERVWRRTSTILPIHLKGLEVEECRLLLQKYAFLQGQYMEKDDLVLIGRGIAESCQGSPLAAKSLGMLLSDTNGDEEEWLNILSQMRILKDDHNKILPSLQISYHHLPYHLKQLFALCCVFPLGHEFQKDEVIRLWIAEGLIQCNAGRRLEAEAGRFFDELLWRSFFETSGCFPNQTYRVPNLMHELALLVSNCEFLSIEPDNLQDEKNSKLVRYGSILCQKDKCPELNMICCYENMRILRLCTEGRVPLKCVPSELFVKLSCLRTLDMSHSELEELPDSVGCLTQLRYLGLRKTLIKRLPESVSSLFNLQTLDLTECYRLIELPDSVGCLTQLRYLGLRKTLIKRLPESVSSLFNLQTLDLTECYRLIELPERMSRLVNLRHLCLHLEWDRMIPIPMPRGIDKLTSLQTLSRFTVTAVPAEAYCNMKELKNMKNIRGELCLLKLEAATHNNAKEADLSRKQYVETLMLHWSDDAYNNSQAVNESLVVIESLGPHGRLRCLRIDGYPGTELPDWMGENSFACLENVRISYCRKLGFHPPLGVLPKLKILHLEGLHNMKSMGTLLGFPSLEVLTLWDMPNLQTWCDSEEAELPKLRELYISRCPELQTEDLRQLLQLSALKRLKIGDFKQLLSVSGDSSMEELSSLEFLEISSCPKLQKISVGGLQALKDFRVRHCTDLETLPTGLGDLRSLRYLEIHDVPNLVISAGDMVLPDNVSYLALSGCQALESWCRSIGAERVSTIPDVKIGL